MTERRDPRSLLHVAVRAELAACAEQADYAPLAFAAEGFVHCCWPEQLGGVLSRYFRGRDDLVLLTLDANRLTALLREEAPPRGTELFPHVYGALPRQAVIEETPIATDADGRRLDVGGAGNDADRETSS